MVILYIYKLCFFIVKKLFQHKIKSKRHVFYSHSGYPNDFQIDSWIFKIGKRYYLYNNKATCIIVTKTFDEAVREEFALSDELYKKYLERMEGKA